MSRRGEIVVMAWLLTPFLAVAMFFGGQVVRAQWRTIQEPRLIRAHQLENVRLRNEPGIHRLSLETVDGRVEWTAEVEDAEAAEALRAEFGRIDRDFANPVCRVECRQPGQRVYWATPHHRCGLPALAQAFWDLVLASIASVFCIAAVLSVTRPRPESTS